MSMNLASFYHQAVFGPYEAVRQRLHARPRPVAAHQKDTRERLSPGDAAERLERIATYARAGYFNMGYTLEMLHMIGEIEPE